MHEVIGHGPNTSPFKFLYLGETSGGCELPPRGELIAREAFPAEQVLPQSVGKNAFKGILCDEPSHRFGSWSYNYQS